MRFGAGEVLQGRSVGPFGHDPQVHLQAVPQAHRHLGRAAGQHTGDGFVAGKAVHHIFTAAAGNQQVQVANRIAAAAVTAGHFDLSQPRRRLQMPHDGVGVHFRLGQVDTAAGFLHAVQRLEDLLLRLGPEPLQLGDTVFLDRLAKLVERSNSQLLVKSLGPFGAQAGYVEQVP